MERDKDGSAENGYRRNSSSEQILLPIMTSLAVDCSGHQDETSRGSVCRGLGYLQLRVSLESFRAIQPTTSLALLPPIDGIVKSRSALSLPEGDSDAGDSRLRINRSPTTPTPTPTTTPTPTSRDVRCSVYNERRIESTTGVKYAVRISDPDSTDEPAPSSLRSLQVARKQPPHSTNLSSEQSESSASNVQQRRFTGYLIPLNVRGSASGVLEDQRNKTLKYPCPLAGIQSRNVKDAGKGKSRRYSVDSEHTNSC